MRCLQLIARLDALDHSSDKFYSIATKDVRLYELLKKRRDKPMVANARFYWWG